MASTSDPHGKAQEPSFHFQMEKDLGDLSRLLGQLEEFGEAHEVSPAHTQRVVLSVDELVTNVIKYGLSENDHSHIYVWATISEDAFRIEIEDRGIPFDPFHEAPVPDTSLPLEDRPIGGLGVFLVQSLMTSVNYERVRDRNRITLVRSLSTADQEEAL